MDFNQVQINKVDNGYVVSTTKFIFGDPKPENQVNVFREFNDVLAFISPVYLRKSKNEETVAETTSTIVVE